MSKLQNAKEHYYNYIARWGSGKYSANYIKELEKANKEMRDALILALKSHIKACRDIVGCPYACSGNHDCIGCIHHDSEEKLLHIIEKATGQKIEEIIK